ncbi:MAG: low-specificity L-threonine aldolase [Acidimicrobiales bacterium]|nr:low-specificity L-threonine aldolase [Acidimicrobiales bacterium]
MSGTPIRGDFRSDTLTVASPAMREAMATADVGDDVYGEDPTVNRLQDHVAELTGKETALFLTSGTQSNLSAVLAHCRRGDEFIIGSNYHIYLNEASGASAFAGASPWAIEVDANGSLTPDAVRAAVREPDQHHPESRLLCLENTVNGNVQPVDLIAKLAATGHDCGLAVHLDGARLFNAAAACDVGIDAFLDDVDTVSLCLSKGLGAPAGTVLAGDRSIIERAFRARKMLGGGMRQVGHLAAAGLHALEHNVERLCEDHARAERIAEGLRAIDAMSLTQGTNMLWVTPPAEHHDDLVAHLESEGLLGIFWKPTMRFVTHLGIDDDQADALVESFTRFFAGR